MFKNGLYYLAVSRNAFEITNLATGEKTHAIPESPFTTQRLLVGDFAVAEATLIKLLRQIKAPAFSTLIVHPLEMNEGGLSFVEQRAMTEMALGAGARIAILHEGPRLSREDGMALIKNQAKSAARPVGDGRQLPTWMSILVILGFIGLLVYLAAGQS